MIRRVTDINIKKALRPFRAKLIAQAAIMSIISGALIALPIWFALAIARRAFDSGIDIVKVIPPLWSFATICFYVFKNRPTLKQTALILDAMGQRDRISTMVEFSKSDSIVCKLQRDDAISRLQTVSVSMIPVRISVVAIAVCLFFAAAIIAADYVPDDVIALIPGRNQAQSEGAILIAQKIEELRERVESSSLSEEDKADLFARLDEMKAQMEAGMFDISQLAQINRMMDEMSQTVDEMLPAVNYSEVLLEFESLRALGEAIISENMDNVTMALDAMGDDLTSKEGLDQVNAIMTIVYDIGDSLGRPVQDESYDDIAHIMGVLSGGLEGAAALVYNHRDNTQMINRALNSAEDGIYDFLNDDGEEQAEEDDQTEEDEPEVTYRIPARTYQQSDYGAVQDYTQTEYVYDPSQAARADDYAPGEMGDDGIIQRLPAPQDENLDGTVPYGTVYGKYYADYLDQMSTEAVPEALRETVEEYFNGI
ncbi:MAG: hypothetical protein Q4D04_08605 [Clostridia bacterium]|nr:hypothetical protein [Clostridia bacterium]